MFFLSCVCFYVRTHGLHGCTVYGALCQWFVVVFLLSGSLCLTAAWFNEIERCSEDTVPQFSISFPKDAVLCVETQPINLNIT